jgi:hypothetical protein
VSPRIDEPAGLAVGVSPRVTRRFGEAGPFRAEDDDEDECTDASGNPPESAVVTPLEVGCRAPDLEQSAFPRAFITTKAQRHEGGKAGLRPASFGKSSGRRHEDGISVGLCVFVSLW